MEEKSDTGQGVYPRAPGQANRAATDDGAQSPICISQKLVAVDRATERKRLVWLPSDRCSSTRKLLASSSWNPHSNFGASYFRLLARSECQPDRSAGQAEGLSQ